MKDTAERDYEKPCAAWRQCCCQRADDGHCWYCGFPKAAHAARPGSTPTGCGSPKEGE